MARYKVLVLANTACIDETQAAAIREFVKNGGGLVATLDTSLFDETGNPRPNFLLADLFGVDYKGLPSTEGGKTEQLDVNFLMGVSKDYFEKRKSIFDFALTKDSLFDTPAEPRLAKYIGKAAVCFKGQAVLVASNASGAPTSSTALTTSAVEVLATLTPRVAGAAAIPAVIARTYGKGRVAYLPLAMDSAYYLYPYPYERLILSQAMRWAAAAPIGIRVDAPMNVQSTFFRQKKDGERLVVHLYNDFVSTSRHALPSDDIPMREEIVPMHDIKVSFTGYDISSIHLEPEGTNLPMSKADNKITVTIPRLDIHSMVVAELNAAKE